MQSSHGYHFGAHCNIRKYVNFCSDLRVRCTFRCYGDRVCVFPLRAVWKEKFLSGGSLTGEEKWITAMIFDLLSCIYTQSLRDSFNMSYEFWEWMERNKF